MLCQLNTSSALSPPILLQDLSKITHSFFQNPGRIMNNYPDRVTLLTVVGKGILKEFNENMMLICGKKIGIPGRINNESK